MWALIASIVVLLVFVAIQYASIALIDALRKRFWKGFSTQSPLHYNYDSSYASSDRSFTWSDSGSSDTEGCSSDGGGDCNDGL